MAEAYRLFAARVARVLRLSPAFTRVTLAGESLAGFAGHGSDQRINLLFLPADADPEAYAAGPDWYGRWRAEPVASRPPLRTYTVRAFRPERRELDVDFVLHGATGPASRWATDARPGDPITLVGPVAGVDAPVADVAWAPPPGADRLVLAADASALPAASAIAEGLGPDRRATMVLEVPEPADEIPFAAPAGVRVVWLARSRGERLEPVVRELCAELFPAAVPPRAVGPTPDACDEEDPWDVPDDGPAAGADGCYAWFAGEAGAVVALRRHLVRERGLDRRSVAFMGYWRRGRAQPN